MAVSGGCAALILLSVVALGAAALLFIGLCMKSSMRREAMNNVYEL